MALRLNGATRTHTLTHMRADDKYPYSKCIVAPSFKSCQFQTRTGSTQLFICSICALHIDYAVARYLILIGLLFTDNPSCYTVAQSLDVYDPNGPEHECQPNGQQPFKQSTQPRHQTSDHIRQAILTN